MDDSCRKMMPFDANHPKLICLISAFTFTHIKHISALFLGSARPSVQMQGTYAVFVVAMATSRHFHLKFSELQKWKVVGTEAERQLKKIMRNVDTHTHTFTHWPLIISVTPRRECCSGPAHNTRITLFCCSNNCIFCCFVKVCEKQACTSLKVT